MAEQGIECVIVIGGGCPAGLAANTATILGAALGKLRPELVGAAVLHQDGSEHAGIVEIPLPILRAGPEHIRQIRSALQTPDCSDLAAADFTDLAQGCRTCSEYERKLASCAEASLRSIAVGLCGREKKVNRLTGNLPLLH